MAAFMGVLIMFGVIVGTMIVVLLFTALVLSIKANKIIIKEHKNKEKN